MKAFRILFRSINDGLRSVFRNFSLSIASILCTTITLILVSIAILISVNVNSFTKDLEKDLTIIVFMDRDATSDDATKLENKLNNLNNVDTIEYESKEDVKAEMMGESDTFSAIMGSWDESTNPLQNQFTIKVKDVEDLNKTAKTIEKYDKVDSVQYGEGMVEKMVSLFGFIQKSTIVIVIALIIVTAFLISNTIKITIFSRRNEIEIMRLVGTGNFVIRLPFLFEGFFLGIIGSIIPILITIYGYMLAYDKLGGYLFSNIIKMVKPVTLVFYVAAILLVIGAVVGMVGSYRSVRKHLKI